MIVLCEEQRDLPLCHIAVAVRTGSAADPTAKEGLAYHAAELMRRGAAELSRRDLDLKLDDLGASLDVTCSRDAVSFTGRCLSRHLPSFLSLVGACLVRPALAEEEHARLVRESLAVLEDLRDDDALLCQRYFERYAMDGHPYGRDCLGTATSLSSLSVNDAAQWVKTNVVPGNLIVGFAGDVSEAQARELATRCTAGLRQAPAPQATWMVPLPKRQGRTTILVDKPEREQSQILIGHEAPRHADPAWLPLHVAATLLGGTFTSRLMTEVRVKRGWSYGADCRAARGRAGHTFRIRVFPALEQTPDTLALVLSLWEDIVETGITRDELDFAKSYLEGNWAFEIATAADRLERRLDTLLLDLPPETYPDFVPRLGRVTLEEVNTAMRTHWRPRDAVSVVVSTADELSPHLSGLPLGDVQIVPYDSY